MEGSWTRLRDALTELVSSAPAAAGGRVGATLVLLSDDGDEHALLYTRRRDDLPHHPGQICFPGGRVERGESVVDAALREAAEEVALDPGTVEVVGRLPAFYIPPSRFWLHAVVARWVAPHPLRADEREVAEIIEVPLDHLRDPARWRVTRLSTRGDMWAWRLDGGHLLWGATAAVTSVLLGLIDPCWHGGTDVADLGPEREERPWEVTGTVVPRPGPARLAGVPEVGADVARNGADVAGSGADAPGDVDVAARLTAHAARQLLPERAGRVLVLAGSGRTGAVGIRAAADLVAAGHDVRVVMPAGSGPPHPSAGDALAALGDRLARHACSLPGCDLVVDALVGRGLAGALRGGARDLVLALRSVTAPVLSVDLPSGIDPAAGVVGDTVAADVTLALGAPAAGLFHPGLAPYVGDLYVVAAQADAAELADPILRVVPAGSGA